MSSARLRRFDRPVDQVHADGAFRRAAHSAHVAHGAVRVVVIAAGGSDGKEGECGYNEQCREQESSVQREYLIGIVLRQAVE